MRADCVLLTWFELRPISPAPVLKTSASFMFSFLFPLSILPEYDILTPDVNPDNEYNLYHAIYVGTSGYARQQCSAMTSPAQRIYLPSYN